MAERFHSLTLLHTGETATPELSFAVRVEHSISPLTCLIPLFLSQYGWNTTRGWDPVTGLGTPLFDKLLAAALKAPPSPAISPSPSPGGSIDIDNHGGISPGEIGALVVVPLLLMFGGVGFFLWRRRRLSEGNALTYSSLS